MTNLLASYVERKKEILFQHIEEELAWHVEAGNIKSVDAEEGETPTDITIVDTNCGYSLIHLDGLILFVLHPVRLVFSHKSQQLEIKMQVTLNRKKLTNA